MNDVSNLRLILAQGDDYSRNQGDYFRTYNKVGGKNIWVSQSISRMMFYANDKWNITTTDYMQEVISGKTTGGFTSSNNTGVPYEADWGPNYKVSEVSSETSQLQLILLGNSTTKSQGEYSRTDNKVRGKDIWVCPSNNQMMFYEDSGWAITYTDYMQDVINGTATGGLLFSKAADVPYEADWSPKYKVSQVSASGWVPATDVFRSAAVHIWWSFPVNQGITWFYNEITVTESAEKTYFVANGFTGGYFGIQDDTNKQVHFSIWDKISTDANPHASDDDLVQVLAHGQGVVVDNFAGEGTGLKSHLTYDWKVGHTYQLMVNVRPSMQASDKAIFTGWFRIPEQNIWRMIASFQVRPTAASKKLEGFYSFIEDWAGNGYRRQGLWGPAWIKSDSGPWVQATSGECDTTEPIANNRNAFLSNDQRKIGMTTGGPALTDTSLGPYTCQSSPIPSVLTSNALPVNDGDPAFG